MIKYLKKCCWLLFLFLSCNNNENIKKELNDAYTNLNDTEYFAELNRLIEEYPENYYVNIDMGYLYLLNNDFANAEKHLRTAEANVVKKDKEWGYKLYSALSDLTYLKGMWDDSVSYGEMALSLDENDHATISRTIAKSYLKLKKFEKSYEYFKVAYEEYAKHFTSQDWNDLSELAILYEDFDFAYDLWMRFWMLNGYEPGLGVRISVLSGKNGDKIESFVNSFIDLDYQNELGLLEKNDLKSYLDKVKGINSSSVLNNALNYYINKDWYKAYELLRGLESKSVALKFLLVSCKIEDGSVTNEEFNDYIDILPYFYNHPQFFNRAIKTGLKHDKYSKEFFLEQAILYSNNSDRKRYREQLGMLAGLGREQVPYFLISQEIRNLGNEYRMKKDLELLRPLIHFLNIKEVYTTESAMKVLKVLSGDPVVHEYLTLIEESAEGILKVRLRTILK